MKKLLSICLILTLSCSNNKKEFFCDMKNIKTKQQEKDFFKTPAVYNRYWIPLDKNKNKISRYSLDLYEQACFLEFYFCDGKQEETILYPLKNGSNIVFLLTD